MLISLLRLDHFVARADRIVAVGRAVLAAAALAAMWLEPIEPTRYRTAARVLLLAYTCYAAVFAAVICWREKLDDRPARFAQVCDLCVFAVLIHLIGGAATGPLFGFLTFTLIAAALCWAWQGVLWTSVACLVILLSLNVTAPFLHGPVGLERAAVQTAYLLVPTFMLASLGLHQFHVRAELRRLAADPIGLPSSGGWPVREALHYAQGVLRTGRALLVWREPDEPWLYRSLWEAGTLQEERVPPGRHGRGVAEPLHAASFLSLNAKLDDAIVHDGSGRFERWRGPVLHRELVTRYRMRSVLGVPVPSDVLDAHLLLLSDQGFTTESLLVAEAAAGRIGHLFEQARLANELRDAAAAAERVRLARDLHDGVLQALAGTALQLASLTHLIEQDPQAASRRLGTLREVLLGQQRELRVLIGMLEPDRTGPHAQADSDLVGRLRDLGARLEQQWKIAVDWRLKPDNTVLDASTAHELIYVMSEVVANAARHGGAKNVTMLVDAADGVLRLMIEEDGRGFPFTGRYNEAALGARGWGPRRLRERIVAQAGSLVIDAHPGRTRYEIALPQARLEAAA